MASPIFDGVPVSLPISYPSGNITFKDLGLSKLVSDLSNGKLLGSVPCHPDPDLKVGAFGQVSAAQGHLDNQGAGEGDLFLFFGTFKEAQLLDNKFIGVEGTKESHIIFGWLFVKKRFQIGSKVENFARDHPDFSHHPHAIGNWGMKNTIFIAPENQGLFNKVKVRGFGTFQSTRVALLSSPNSSIRKSLWKIPD